MSSLDRPSGTEPEPNSEGDLVMGPGRGQELAPIDAAELARLEASSARSVTLRAGGTAAAAADALIPLAANAAQAAQTYGMAVVKFPEGVTWADLCVRQSDGWNLLSNLKNGEFNTMAGIKRAGLQPAAAANLALQGAAVAVGMAYMNEISGKLDGLQSSVNELQRDMERERDAGLKAAYDSLVRLAVKFGEYGAIPEKRVSGYQVVERALMEADDAWNYQMGRIADYAAELESKKKLSAKEIVSASAKLTVMEERAAAAFQLTLAAQQIDMRLDNDYTAQRLANDRRLTEKKVAEFRETRGAARLVLSGKVSKVGGNPLALADRVEDGYQAPNPVLGVLHEGARNADRLNPLRMRRKAEQDLSAKRARLQDVVTTANTVDAIAKSAGEELDALRFAFNEADTVVFDGENLRLFKSADSETARPKASGQ